jgi:hypothetical protein
LVIRDNQWLTAKANADGAHSAAKELGADADKADADLTLARLKKDPNASKGDLSVATLHQQQAQYNLLMTEFNEGLPDNLRDVQDPAKLSPSEQKAYAKAQYDFFNQHKDELSGYLIQNKDQLFNGGKPMSWKSGANGSGIIQDDAHFNNIVAAAIGTEAGDDKTKKVEDEIKKIGGNHPEFSVETKVYASPEHGWQTVSLFKVKGSDGKEVLVDESATRYSSEEDFVKNNQLFQDGTLTSSSGTDGNGKMKLSTTQANEKSGAEELQENSFKLMVAGMALEVVGTLLDATGAGAIVGVPLNALGATMIDASMAMGVVGSAASLTDRATNGRSINPLTDEGARGDWLNLAANGAGGIGSVAGKVDKLFTPAASTAKLEAGYAGLGSKLGTKIATKFGSEATFTLSERLSARLTQIEATGGKLSMGAFALQLAGPASQFAQAVKAGDIKSAIQIFKQEAPTLALLAHGMLKPIATRNLYTSKVEGNALGPDVRVWDNKMRTWDGESKSFKKVDDPLNGTLVVKGKEFKEFKEFQINDQPLRINKNGALEVNGKPLTVNGEPVELNGRTLTLADGSRISFEEKHAAPGAKATDGQLTLPKSFTVSENGELLHEGAPLGGMKRSGPASHASPTGGVNTRPSAVVDQAVQNIVNTRDSNGVSERGSEENHTQQQNRADQRSQQVRKDAVTTDMRPTHQAQIEKALNDGNFDEAEKINNKLPDSDPYKATNASVIRISKGDGDTGRSPLVAKYIAELNGKNHDAAKTSATHASGNTSVPEDFSALKDANRQVNLRTATQTRETILNGGAEEQRLSEPAMLRSAKTYEANGLPADATPDTKVSVYRAGESGKSIDVGDFVSLTKAGAEKYVQRTPGLEVTEKQVALKDLVYGNGTRNEYVFSPKSLQEAAKPGGVIASASSQTIEMRDPNARPTFHVEVKAKAGDVVFERPGTGFMVSEGTADSTLTIGKPGNAQGGNIALDMQNRKLADAPEMRPEMERIKASQRQTVGELPLQPGQNAQPFQFSDEAVPTGRPIKNSSGAPMPEESSSLLHAQSETDFYSQLNKLSDQEANSLLKDAEFALEYDSYLRGESGSPKLETAKQAQLRDAMQQMSDAERSSLTSKAKATVEYYGVKTLTGDAASTGIASNAARNSTGTKAAGNKASGASTDESAASPNAVGKEGTGGKVTGAGEHGGGKQSGGGNQQSGIEEKNAGKSAPGETSAEQEQLDAARDEIRGLKSGKKGMKGQSPDVKPTENAVKEESTSIGQEDVSHPETQESSSYHAQPEFSPDEQALESLLKAKAAFDAYHQASLASQEALGLRDMVAAARISAERARKAADKTAAVLRKAEIAAEANTDPVKTEKLAGKVQAARQAADAAQQSAVEANQKMWKAAVDWSAAEKRTAETLVKWSAAEKDAVMAELQVADSARHMKKTAAEQAHEEAAVRRTKADQATGFHAYRDKAVARNAEQEAAAADTVASDAAQAHADLQEKLETASTRITEAEQYMAQVEAQLEATKVALHESMLADTVSQTAADPVLDVESAVVRMEKEDTRLKAAQDALALARERHEKAFVEMKQANSEAAATYRTVDDLKRKMIDEAVHVESEPPWSSPEAGFISLEPLGHVVGHVVELGQHGVALAGEMGHHALEAVRHARHYLDMKRAGSAAKDAAEFVSAPSAEEAETSVAKSAGELPGQGDRRGVNQFVYRVDRRHPDKVLGPGFQPKGANTDLADFVNLSRPSIYVSATERRSRAVELAKDLNIDGFVYTIRRPDNAIDVNSMLGMENAWSHELEVVLPKGVHSSYIVGAQRVTAEGKLIGPYIKNPHYMEAIFEHGAERSSQAIRPLGIEGLDQLTEEKIEELNRLDVDHPAGEGLVRVYRASTDGAAHGAVFKYPEQLAQFMNGRTQEETRFEYQDVYPQHLKEVDKETGRHQVEDAAKPDDHFSSPEAGFISLEPIAIAVEAVRVAGGSTVDAARHLTYAVRNAFRSIRYRMAEPAEPSAHAVRAESAPLMNRTIVEKLAAEAPDLMSKLADAQAHVEEKAAAAARTGDELEHAHALVNALKISATYSRKAAAAVQDASIADQIATEVEAAAKAGADMHDAERVKEMRGLADEKSSIAARKLMLADRAADKVRQLTEPAESVAEAPDIAGAYVNPTPVHRQGRWWQETLVDTVSGAKSFLHKIYGNGNSPDVASDLPATTEWAQYMTGRTRRALRFGDVHFHRLPYDRRVQLDMESMLDMSGPQARIAFGAIPQGCGKGYYSNADSWALSYQNAELLDHRFASEHMKLAPALQARADVMITGYNPADFGFKKYAQDLLLKYPGVFKGIGELTIHKEYVEAKLGAEAVSLDHSSLREVFDVAQETGLVLLIHCDWGDAPVNGESHRHEGGAMDYRHFDKLIDLTAQYPDARIVLAHTGIGRYARADTTMVKLEVNGVEKQVPRHIAYLYEAMNRSPNVHFDISWNDVAETYVFDKAMGDALFDFIVANPDKILYGSDSVKPANQAFYLQNWTTLQPLFDALDTVDPHIAWMVERGNYERLFNGAEMDVANWTRPRLIRESRLDAVREMDERLANIQTERRHQRAALMPLDHAGLPGMADRTAPDLHAARDRLLESKQTGNARQEKQSGKEAATHDRSRTQSKEQAEAGQASPAVRRSLSSIVGKLLHGFKDLGEDGFIMLPFGIGKPDFEGTLFRRAEGEFVPEMKSFDRVLTVDTDRRELLRQLSRKLPDEQSRATAESFVGQDMADVMIQVDRFLEQHLSAQFDAIGYLNRHRPGLGAEFHELESGWIYRQNESIAKENGRSARVEKGIPVSNDVHEQVRALVSDIRDLHRSFEYPEPEHGKYTEEDAAYLGQVLAKTKSHVAHGRDVSRLWPGTPEEMDHILGMRGLRIPDSEQTPGRNRVLWKLDRNLKLKYEQHPYDISENAGGTFHLHPHWHIDGGPASGEATGNGIFRETYVPSEIIYNHSLSEISKKNVASNGKVETKADRRGVNGFVFVFEESDAAMNDGASYGHSRRDFRNFANRYQRGNYVSAFELRSHAQDAAKSAETEGHIYTVLRPEVPLTGSEHISADGTPRIPLPEGVKLRDIVGVQRVNAEGELIGPYVNHLDYKATVQKRTNTQWREGLRQWKERADRLAGDETGSISIEPLVQAVDLAKAAIGRAGEKVGAIRSEAQQKAEQLTQRIEESRKATHRQAEKLKTDLWKAISFKFIDGQFPGKDEYFKEDRGSNIPAESKGSGTPLAVNPITGNGDVPVGRVSVPGDSLASAPKGERQLVTPSTGEAMRGNPKTIKGIAAATGAALLGTASVAVGFEPTGVAHLMDSLAFVARGSEGFARTAYKETLRLIDESIKEEGHASDAAIIQGFEKIRTEAKQYGIPEKNVDEALEATRSLLADIRLIREAPLRVTESSYDRSDVLIARVGVWSSQLDRAVGIQTSAMDGSTPRSVLGKTLRLGVASTLAINLAGDLQHVITHLNPETTTQLLNLAQNGLFGAAEAMLLARAVYAFAGGLFRRNMEEADPSMPKFQQKSMPIISAASVGLAAVDAISMNIPAVLMDLGLALGAWKVGKNEKMAIERLGQPKPSVVSGAMLLLSGSLALRGLLGTGQDSGSQVQLHPGLPGSPLPQVQPTASAQQDEPGDDLLALPIQPAHPGELDNGGEPDPITQQKPNSYVVHEGDSLWKIAHDHESTLLTNTQKQAAVTMTEDQITLLALEELMNVNPEFNWKPGLIDGKVSREEGDPDTIRTGWNLNVAQTGR